MMTSRRTSSLQANRRGLALVALLGLGWLACEDPLVDREYEGAPYLALSGPVTAEAGATTGSVSARVAWLWWESDQFAAVARPVPLEPGVLSYRIEVLHPPTVEEFSDATWYAGGHPPQPDGLTLLVGLPVLVDDGGSEEPLDLTVDGEALLRWLLWSEFDARAAFPDPAPDEATVLATTRGHLLVAMTTEAGAASLVDLPGGDAAELCPIAGVVPGLTLYQRHTDVCGGWLALAAAGERGEFQGIPMSDPSP